MPDLGEGRRTALVHDWLTVPGGSEDVFREVCGMAPQGVVHTSQWDPNRILFIAGHEVRTSFVNRLPLSKKRHYLYAPILGDVYRRMDLTKFDLILCDSHSFAHGVKVRKDATFVCYYHTPARSLWTPEIDGRASGGRAQWVRRAIISRLKKMDLAASANPTVLMANSKTTAERIQRFYGRAVDAVVYPPVDVSKWSDVERKSEDEGLLFWGRLIPYKRVDLAIEAARITGEKLQIVGKGPLEETLKAQARDLPNVTFHGRLSDEELKRLMARCRAVLFPCYEDFGIVPVEAMAAGLPVISYGIGGAGETVRPDCGVLFHEQTAEALVEAIFASTKQDFEVATLKTHAQSFDASVFRKNYRAVVERALNR